MSLFKKSTEIDDEYSLKFPSDSKFDLNKNGELAKIIEKLSRSQLEDGLYPLNKTWPEATFVTGQQLLEAIRDELVLGTGEVRDFEISNIEVYQFNANAKRGKDNPKKILDLKDVSINIDFVNITELIVEATFTSLEYANTSYETKADVASTLVEYASQVLALDSEDVAIIPEEIEADQAIENGLPVSRIPSRSITSKDPFDDGEEDEKPPFDTVTAPNSGDGDEEDDDGEVTEPISPKGNGSLTASLQKKLENNRGHGESNEVVPGDIDETVTDLAVISAGKYTFDVKSLKEVDPGQDGYVRYALNEVKMRMNKIIQAQVEQTNNKGHHQLIELRNKLKDQAKDATHTFDVDNDPTNGLKEEVEDLISPKQQNELAAGLDKIKNQYDSQRATAEADYNHQLDDIAAAEKADTDDLVNELQDRFVELRNNKYQELYQAEVEKQRNKRVEFVSDINQDIYDKLDDAAAKIAVENGKVLKALIEAFNEQLVSYTTQFEIQDSNAREARASEAKIRTKQYEYDDYLKLKKENAQTQAANVSLEAQKNNLLQKNLKLTEEKANLDKLLEKGSDEKGSSAIDRYIDFQIAQSMKIDKPQREAVVQSEAVPDQTKNSVELEKNVSKGLKRTATSLGVLVLLIAGGAGFYTYHQHQEYESQQTTLKSQLQSVKTASSSNSVKKSDVEAKTTATAESTKSTKAADVAAETTAFHDGDLDKVKSYNGSKYQSIDEAILNKNASWLQSALNQLQASTNSYKLDDDSRVTQTVQLLKDEKMDDLATQVQDANK